MKKLISALVTLAIILSVSSCGEKAPETTTASTNGNSAAEVGAEGGAAELDTENSSAAETTEATETAETEEATEPAITEEATEPAITEEATEPAATTEEATETTVSEAAPEGELIESSFLDGLKDKSPLYYEFGKITSTVPVTITMTVMDSDGSEMGTMRMTMASLNRIAMLTQEAEQSARVILDNGTNYIVSDDDKYAMYYSLSDEERAAMEEELLNSMQFTTSFDFDKAEFSSGTTEFMGESLKYETVDDGITEATLYFDPETDRAKYIVSEGQTVRIDEYYTGADDSLFEIPQDYEMIDFDAFMGELSATE